MAYPKRGQRGTGRRKEAVARVRLLPGNGVVLINGKTPEQYFGARKCLHLALIQPLVTAELVNNYNVLINAHGGGLTGQAEAALLGVARALVEIKPELRVALRAEGYLTRDPRAKERKKYGLEGARRAFQFSKR
jgi:small subunit ribosomal protein S9